MRATLTLDDDVTALLKRARQDRGQSLQEFANELLRRTLEQLGAGRVEREATERVPAKTTDHQAASAEPYRIRPFSSGRCFFENLDNVAEVLAQAEGEDFR